MKKYYSICKIFIITCSICIVCYGSVNSNSLLNKQDKSTVMNQSDVVYQREEVDVKAVVKKTGYPKGRGCKDAEVKVLLRVILHSSGKVTDVEVLESSTCKDFENAAIKLAKKLKFTPAKKNGIAVSQYQKLEYNYSFHDAVS